MKIKKIREHEYKVEVSSNDKASYYTNSYNKALYYAALELVGDSLPYESLESFHTALKIALNREFSGKLGDKIDFTGQWWYPTVKYCQNKQGKVKTL